MRIIIQDAADAALDYVGAADRLCICSGIPATYVEATVDLMLAINVIGAADFTLTPGVRGGGTLTLAAQAPFVVAVSGAATHYALCNSVTAELLLVCPCTPQAVIANTVNTVSTPEVVVNAIGEPV